jgi:regulator of sigma E protease
VKPGEPAARAGLLPGDIILTVDGKPMRTFRELQITTADEEPGAEITVGVERNGQHLTFHFVPEMQRRAHPVTGKVEMIPTMGIGLEVLAEIQPGRVPVTPVEAVEVGLGNTWGIIANTMIYVHDMLFNGADTSQLGGPITIAKVSGDAAEQGFSSLVFLIALLSTSIGLINLFPIPILDGGHLMFYALEGLRGRPVGETSMKVGTMIGLSLVLLLMVFATYNDLVRLL